MLHASLTSNLIDVRYKQKKSQISNLSPYAALFVVVTYVHIYICAAAAAVSWPELKKLLGTQSISFHFTEIGFQSTLYAAFMLEASKL